MSVFIKITLRFSENGCYFTLPEMAARFPTSDLPTPYIPKRDRESDDEEIRPRKKQVRRLSPSSEDSIIPPNRVLTVSLFHLYHLTVKYFF